MRIIAGTARGRRFDAPTGMDTRPTLARVKESVFGMLQFDVPESRVLDLFSGSGNLGLEAASRGAQAVVCNDKSPVCARQIARNAELLKLADTVTVMQCDYNDCIDRLKREGRAFDLAFLDAPYADGTAQKAAERLLSEGLIVPGGRVILEYATTLPPDTSHMAGAVVTSRRYGECAVTIIQKENA